MSRTDVAIVGMACVFPGAGDLDTYWRNLARGVDAISDLPAGRWPGSRNATLPPDHEAHIACRRGGFIPTPYLFDAARHGVTPNVARHGDPDQFILLDLLDDALRDAGVARDDPARADTDLLVGRGGYTSNKMMEVFLRADGFDRLVEYVRRRVPGLGAEVLDGLDAALRETLPPHDVEGLASSIPNLVASRAANRLDLGGAAFTVDAACASSLVAVEQAVQRLRDGRCRLALAGGINFTQVPSFWYLFMHIHAMSASGAIRPFDRRADGMLIGEGAGAVALKRVEDAARDGDRVYAVIRGTGSASDGRSTGLLAPCPRGQVRALERAYDDADLEPDAIGLLEAHGTGTPVGDAAELECLRTVFGPPRGAHGSRWLGSVKSMIGHTMPAAGMASLIKACLALSNKVVPPSLHCEEPHAALAETAFCVNDRARPWLQDPSRLRRAGVNAFGFGGVNAHVILEEVAPVAGARVPPRAGNDRARAGGNGRVHVRGMVARPIQAGVRRPSEVLAFAGRHAADLAAALRRVARFLAEHGLPYTLEDVAFTLAGEADAAAPRRLALVVDDLAGLGPRLEALAAALERGEPVGQEAADCHLSPPPGPSGATLGRVAAVFPGIAFPGLTGEYPNHLLANCLHFPCVREIFDAYEERDRHPQDVLPTGFLLAPPHHLPEDERSRMLARFAPATADDATADTPTPPDERNISHLGMLVNNHASWRLLGALGVRVDMLCGQSLGDVSAVLAAGMTTFEAVMARYWKALALDLSYAGTGCIALVGATEAELEPHLANAEDVMIGLHLSPGTLVVGGPDDGVKALCARLRTAGILAQRLPFPPVHTKQLEPLETAFRTALGDLTLDRPAEITIYSAALAAPMPRDPAGVEPLLHSLMSRPIHFWQTMRRMYADGAHFFVQIGSGTLAANSRSVLDAEDAVFMAMDVAHRHPLTQLQHLAGNLFALGLPVDLEALFAACTPARVPLSTPRERPPRPRTAVPLTLYRPPMVLDCEPAPPPAEAAHSAPAASAGPWALPFLGTVRAHDPGRSLEVTVRVDLDEHRYLADHAFFSPQAGRSLRERFPVVPLTMGLEMLAEAAACLAPGRGLLGFEDVRALRWIACDESDGLDVRVVARVVRTDATVTVVAVEAFVGEQKSLRALVRFGSTYQLGLDFTFRQITDVHPDPLDARQLYDDRVLFHGPRFQALRAVHERGEGGIAGELETLPWDDLFASTPRPDLLTDPIALDGAGQLLGSYFVGGEGYVLPVAIDRVEFYGPPPPRGRRLPTRVEFDEIDFDARRTSARLEIQDGAGGVWCRIAGWQDVVFRWAPRLLELWRHPDRHLLAEERAVGAAAPDAVAVVVEPAWIRDVPTDWLARLVLHADEHAAWRALEGPDRRRRAWLLGRVAVKDAARTWIARRDGGASMLPPTAILVEHDAAGRPVVLRARGRGPVPHVSLSHADDGAVALAASAPVGVDVEPLAAGARLVRGDFASAAELARLDAAAGDDGDAWTTRLWCAKEAAAKCLGEGLGGRPKAFEAVVVRPDGRIAIRPRHGEGVLEVHTTRWGDRVIAAAGRAPGAASDAAPGLASEASVP